MQTRTIYLTILIALIGFSNTQFLAKEAQNFGDDRVQVPDICDVQIALNLKYLLLDVVGQQVQDENGHNFVRINFNFSVKQPSNLTKTCIFKSVKDIYYIDQMNQLGYFDSQVKKQTEQGLYIQLPINDIQNYAISTSTIANQDKIGFSSILNLKLTFGNTRVPVREYQIQYTIDQLANASIQFKDQNISFQNAQVGVRLV
ncbi:transmembrane protein, putative (macronuclear) [Tetrahymena thermophila SB210]|uniref:Transmembrane protein, putative n=1 Tax=Tetrahymena thermophila (strain SB210) TaxID=312017 RepID=Q235N1_TETTS|nr:transmembrane protein, putative [Tetrahymena thermophila SB210]EAR92249.1 transmembrane protein, putative [Tetrahymena thermophila SB210]|eukprot:XP_001012494.1 transmembrane protein, putative [Tetrahymena thermophila SB210]